MRSICVPSFIWIRASMCEYNSRHKFIASPRANRSRYQKSLRNLASPMSWDHVHRVWCSCVENPGRSISNSRACAFKQPMTCSAKVVQLDKIYMCTEFHMNTCKYVWATHQVFWWCSRGRRRASVPRPGPSLSGVLTAAGSNVCANFQEFLTMLSPQKCPDIQKNKLKK